MIFSSVLGKFARFSRIAAGVIVSDFLQIVAPAQKIPTVLGVQVDATLDPGASPADRDAYILTNTAALHANFGSITGVGNGDIVMYKSGAFVVVFDASAAGSNDRVQTRNVATDKDWVYSGGWAATNAGFNNAADEVITGSWSFALNDGVPQLLITDDPGLANATYIFMVGDSTFSPNIRYDMRRLIVDSQNNIDGGYYAYCDLITKENAVVIIAQNGGNVANVSVSTSASGETEAYITGDMVTIDGMQKHLGYKTGTLIAPPAGLIIGEVWADTTDSATHPIYRISTVTT